MEDFVPTRGSQIKKGAEKDFLSINYIARKKKVKKNDDDAKEETQTQRASYGFIRNKPEKDVDPKKQQEREMKRIRYEVIKFGMSGFEKTKAREAKVALAISLGAKPPKNRKINYKLLQAKRKIEKQEEKKDEHVSGLSKSIKRQKPKKPYKKNADGILGVYGKVQKGAVNKRKR